MAETTEPDVDESDDDLDGDGTPPDSKGEARAAAAKAHLAKVDRETVELAGLDASALSKVLREVIAGTQEYTTEALVRICARAHKAGDQKLLSLSFEAAAKTATGLLLGQAFGQDDEARKDQVQEILLQLFAAIRSGKSRLAETFFAQFAKRRAIDQFRQRDAQIEAKLDRQEPTEGSDPIDELSGREPDLEDRVLLSVAIEKLPPKQRTAFIQKHRFRMTNKEIAEQNGVDVRTVHNWLKAADETLGLEGEEE